MSRSPLARLAASLLAFCLSLTPLTAFSLDQKVAQSVQALSWDGDNHCTISSINEKEGYWLTAAHCVEGEPKLYDIAGHKANVIKKSPVLDLAIMVTPDWHVRAIKLSKDAPKYGDEIAMWGHPLGWKSLILFRGYIATPSFTEAGVIEGVPQVLYEMTAAPGNSGSAVVNRHNEMIGCLQWAVVLTSSFSFVTGGVDYPHFYQFMSPWVK